MGRPRQDDLIPDTYIAMGQTAENVAQVTGITREEQDRWAVRSQNRAEEAIKNGFFAREITPVTLPDGTVVSEDDGPRAGTTYEAVSQLRPVFRPDGTVTAGNACPLNDGAAALVIMSDTKAKELGLTPLARIVATGVSGCRQRSWVWARSRRPSVPSRSRGWVSPISTSSRSTKRSPCR